MSLCCCECSSEESGSVLAVLAREQQSDHPGEPTLDPSNTHQIPRAPAARRSLAGQAYTPFGERPRPRRYWGALVGWLVVGTVLASLVLAQPNLSQDVQVAKRRTMVEEQIAERGVRDAAVLAAMREVPRHLFVPSAYSAHAYRDQPLPIGYGQTISQPYIVALMTELLALPKKAKVLEIGTGSGYHAAVLSRVAGQVFTIEIVKDLGLKARRTLEMLDYANVTVRVGDGYRGWPEEAPFDAIILTAAPPEVPKPLLDQLKVGGRMVLPEGAGKIQDLLVITKTAKDIERQRVAAVRFVPMTGEVRREK